MKLRIWIVSLFLIVAASGCSNSANQPTDKNFLLALNAYYQDRNECLFPQGREFPYEVAPGSGAKQGKQQMDALMAAGMFTRLEDLDLHVDSYSLTAIGKRYAPRFCYGHRVIASIVSFTPPGPKNGFTETTVTYRYSMEDVPVWARTDKVEAAFPQLAKSLSDSATDQETLATAGAGWQVPQ
ncbi:MAG TPA: hypothetical protein VMD92_07020 [Acidobacteriaceae bacterium]|jgi:hypothetical protein|nr:hypothetical protein [Acidobacteriaceae bacterium]